MRLLDDMTPAIKKRLGLEKFISIIKHQMFIWVLYDSLRDYPDNHLEIKDSKIILFLLEMYYNRTNHNG